MKQREKGAAAVEFALVLPLMLIMTCLTTEFGRAYYQYNTITKSVREAVRYLSVRAPGVDIDKAKNVVVYGNPDGRGTPLAPGLSVSNVNIPPRGTAGSYPTFSTVSVEVTGYTFIPMVTNTFGMMLGNITFGPIRATMRSPT